MPVTGEQVTALRAFLAFDPSYQRLAGQLSGSGRVHGFGELVYAAFVTAARQRFSPTWTSAQVVRFAGRLRVVLRACDVDLDPRAIEILLRQALGERVASDYDDGTHALVMLFGLGELISDARLDEGGLDAFLADARALADARLAARSGERELAMSAELADRIA
ncbi:MAG: hypothetical protein ABSB59_40715 [Streptosporangiaceae bacterium]